MMKFLFCLFISLLSISSFAQVSSQKLEQAFNTFLNDSQVKYAIASLCVLDAKTGNIIYAKNENVGLATASTLKTITSATAFSILGKDFQYQTTLAYSGNITGDGTLKGDIIIIGSGDPTLGTWRYDKTKAQNVLNTCAMAIKNAGIKKIEGQIIGDDSAWDTQSIPDGWIWQDIGNYYGAGSSALNFRENQFDIHLKPGKAINDSVQIVKTIPELGYLKIVNELKTGAYGSGDKTYAYFSSAANTLYLRGTWGLGIEKPGITAAVPDGAFECAYRLQDTLKQIGINCASEATTAKTLALNNKKIPTVTQKLATLTSPVLSDIIYWFLKKSVNLYGENLLKTIAAKQGKTITTKDGAKAEIAYWANKGFDKNALNIVDGSGLSPANRITTKAMATILYQAQQADWYPYFYNALPEYNGMRLKSGSIADVSAFAGYHTDSKGNKYVVVINVNNYNGTGINKKLYRVLDELK